MLKKAITALIFFLIILTVPTYAHAEQNLVKNPSFEDGMTSWKIKDENLPKEVKCEVVNKTSKNGKKSLSISNSIPYDTLVVQNINVEPGATYKVSFFAKSENIKNTDGAPNLSLFYINNGEGCKGIYTSDEKNTFDTQGKWVEVVFYIRTRADINDPLTIGLRLGGQGVLNEGTAYFDDISVVKADNVPQNAVYYEFPNNYENSTSNNDSIKAKTTNPNITILENRSFLLILAGIIVLLVIVVIQVKLSGSISKDEADTE